MLRGIVTINASSVKNIFIQKLFGVLKSCLLHNLDFKKGREENRILSQLEKIPLFLDKTPGSIPT